MVLVARAIVVMRGLPEAVEGQALGFFDVGFSWRPANVRQDMDGHAAVSPHLPPHLEPKSDISCFEYVRAPIVFDRVSLGREQLPGAGFHLGKEAPHLREIGSR